MLQSFAGTFIEPDTLESAFKMQLYFREEIFLFHNGQKQLICISTFMQRLYANDHITFLQFAALVTTKYTIKIKASLQYYICML